MRTPIMKPESNSALFSIDSIENLRGNQNSSPALLSNRDQDARQCRRSVSYWRPTFCGALWAFCGALLCLSIFYSVLEIIILQHAAIPLQN